MVLETKHLSSDDRAGYIRISTNAQTRLTVSTFLASICLSIFAVFLPNTFQIHGFDLSSILAVIIDVLIGGACVLFLLIATAVSIALIRLSDLNPSFRNLLSDERATIQFSDNERNNLGSIIKLYSGIYRLNYAGIIALLLSLPLMAFRINIWVGIGIVATLIVGFTYFYKSLEFVIFYHFRNTP